MMRMLELINGIVCGIPSLLMILGAGTYLSIRTRFAQIRYFPKALQAFFKQLTGKEANSNGTTSYQALYTALAATVGTGNLAGVAGAIAIGGPGSIFWMWVCGILGMATKFAEATLAVHYRVKNKENGYVGGPMYMIERGLPRKYRFLAVIYCMLGGIAAFGVGNATQVNAVIGGINSAILAYHGVPTMLRNVAMGAVFAAIIAAMLTGGMKRISRLTEQLVPIASLFYIMLCLGALIICRRELTGAFAAIICGAFSPKAVTGGAVISALSVLRVGAARGVFTNEAGLGTAAIAHAAANVEHPVEQGFMGIVEVFIDTIVICTLTALVILCSGTDITYGVDNGANLTTSAFARIYGDWVCIPLAISLCLFAIASILGWALYGGRCLQYLFGDKAWSPFVFLQAVMVVVGACLQTGTVWLLAEIVNGLMAIPNLTVLMLLSPNLARLVDTYRNRARNLTGELNHLRHFG